MDWVEFAKGAGVSVPTLLLFAVYLNYKGTLLWRSQVEREFTAIKEAAAKLDAVRLEQIGEERDDKNEWKSVCDTLKTSIEALKASLESKRAGPS